MLYLRSCSVFVLLLISSTISFAACPAAVTSSSNSLAGTSWAGSISGKNYGPEQIDNQAFFTLSFGSGTTSALSIAGSGKMPNGNLSPILTSAIYVGSISGFVNVELFPDGLFTGVGAINSAPITIYYTYGNRVVAQFFDGNQRSGFGNNILYPHTCFLYVWITDPSVQSVKTSPPPPDAIFVSVNNGNEFLGSSQNFFTSNGYAPAGFGNSFNRLIKQ